MALVVLSNTIYQIMAKSIPEKMNPLASVAITYTVGAISCIVLYFVIAKDPNLAREYSQLNWAPFGMGIAVIGLEVGMILAYKAGWAVNMLSITQSTILAIVLIFVGALAFNEPVTWNKIAGIGACLGGLALINYK